jgi:cell division septum initiation protein DivIVA
LQRKLGHVKDENEELTNEIKELKRQINEKDNLIKE